MSALFNIDALFRLLVLLICTATYIRLHLPSLISKNGKGFYSVFYKLSVVGNRLSPLVAVICVALALLKLVSVFM